MNEYVQVEPVVEDKKKSRVVVSETDRGKTAKGLVISFGEGRPLADGSVLKPNVKVGDEVIYNPHMVSYELNEEGRKTLIINANAIYGKYD